MPSTVSSSDPAVFRKESGGKRADHAGDEGAEAERQADHIGQYHARQHRMGNRIAHQRPALQHQKAG